MTSILVFNSLADVVGIDEKYDFDNKTGYIGFAPTGKIHLGYLVPCCKIRDLSFVGAKIVVLIADNHAMMDDRKTPKELVDFRSEYYQRVLTKLLKTLGANMDNISFIRGSSFQNTPEYIQEVYRLALNVSTSACKKAGTEVVKAKKGEESLGNLLYPVMQAVDESFVSPHLDFELGGLDQRKIFMFSKDHYSKGKIAYLMTPIVSLSGRDKMSASSAKDRVDFTDSKEVFESKIKASFLAPASDGKSLDSPGVLTLLKAFLPPVFYNPIEARFLAESLTPQNLKLEVCKTLSVVMNVMREFLTNEEMVDLTEKAYP